MLKRLLIDNYKCLTNFELKPTAVSCLVGPNASGKSAVLGALRGLQGFSNLGVLAAEAFPSFSRTRWDSRIQQTFEVDAQVFRGASMRYQLVVRHDEKKRAGLVEREAVWSDGKLLYEQIEGDVRLYGDGAASASATFPFDARRSFLPVLEPRPDYAQLTAFKAWLAGIWLFALRPTEMTSEAPDEAMALATEGRNFASWYRTLTQEKPASINALRNSMTPLIPGFEGLRLERLSAASRYLMVDCRLGGRPFSLTLDELSDGQRNLLVLYTVLHAYAATASLLVFDEPDNFVAANEIQPWLSELRAAVVEAGRGTLVVVSHHPEVIDYLSPDQSLLLTRSADGPTRVRNLAEFVDRDTGQKTSELIGLGGPDAQ